MLCRAINEIDLRDLDLLFRPHTHTDTVAESLNFISYIAYTSAIVFRVDSSCLAFRLAFRLAAEVPSPAV